MMVTMKRTLLAMTTAAAVLFGGAGVAQATHGITHANSVTNSIYSTSSTIVCGATSSGDSGCGYTAPGQQTYATNNWNPTAVAVGPYYVALYRAVVNHGGPAVTTQWYGFEGGRYGKWIDVGAIQRFWGGDGVKVEVIIDGPFY